MLSSRMPHDVFCPIDCPFKRSVDVVSYLDGFRSEISLKLENYLQLLISK